MEAILKENEILARSLILAYENYVSMTSRRLLEPFSMFVFEMHCSTEKENKGCEALQKDFKYEKKYMNTHIYLDHLKVCQFGTRELIQKFASVSDDNIHLNLFIHNISSEQFNEIVIINQILDQCFYGEILDNILTDLKEKFKGDRRGDLLPKEILRMNKNTSYKDLACYQIASKIKY